MPAQGTPGSGSSASGKAKGPQSTKPAASSRTGGTGRRSTGRQQNTMPDDVKATEKELKRRAALERVPPRPAVDDLTRRAQIVDAFETYVASCPLNKIVLCLGHEEVAKILSQSKALSTQTANTRLRIAAYHKITEELEKRTLNELEALISDDLKVKEYDVYAKPKSFDLPDTVKHDKTKLREAVQRWSPECNELLDIEEEWKKEKDEFKRHLTHVGQLFYTNHYQLVLSKLSAAKGSGSKFAKRKTELLSVLERDIQELKSTLKFEKPDWSGSGNGPHSKNTGLGHLGDFTVSDDGKPRHSESNIPIIDLASETQVNERIEQLSQLEAAFDNNMVPKCNALIQRAFGQENSRSIKLKALALVDEVEKRHQWKVDSVLSDVNERIRTYKKRLSNKIQATLYELDILSGTPPE